MRKILVKLTSMVVIGTIFFNTAFADLGWAGNGGLLRRTSPIETRTSIAQIEAAFGTEKREAVASLYAMATAPAGDIYSGLEYITNRTSPATILVVDDKLNHIRDLIEALRQKGHKVLEAENGEEALDIVNSDLKPDLVISDVKMPGINGYELAKKLPGTIFVLMSTGLIMQDLLTPNVKATFRKLDLYIDGPGVVDGPLEKALGSTGRSSPLSINDIPPVPLLQFYAGKRADHRGRIISDIWNFDNRQLESVHDYIQVLFPLRRLGRFFEQLTRDVKGDVIVPVLTDEDIEAFRSDTDLGRKLRGNMVRSLSSMLNFYGLQYVFRDDEVYIEPSPSFEERCQNWLSEPNHNFLRITRILKSLRLAGLDNYAMAFFNALSDLNKTYSSIIGDSFDHWRKAVEGLDQDSRLTYAEFSLYTSTDNSGGPSRASPAEMRLEEIIRSEKPEEKIAGIDLYAFNIIEKYGADLESIRERLALEWSCYRNDRDESPSLLEGQKTADRLIEIYMIYFGSVHIELLLHPGISTRLDQFVEFVQKQELNLADFTAYEIVKRFREYLGFRILYRALMAERPEMEDTDEPYPKQFSIIKANVLRNRSIKDLLPTSTSKGLVPLYHVHQSLKTVHEGTTSLISFSTDRNIALFIEHWHVHPPPPWSDYYGSIYIYELSVPTFDTIEIDRRFIGQQEIMNISRIPIPQEDLEVFGIYWLNAQVLSREKIDRLKREEESDKAEKLLREKYRFSPLYEEKSHDPRPTTHDPKIYSSPAGHGDESIQNLPHVNSWSKVEEIAREAPIVNYEDILYTAVPTHEFRGVDERGFSSAYRERKIYSRYRSTLLWSNATMAIAAATGVVKMGYLQPDFKPGICGVIFEVTKEIARKYKDVPTPLREVHRAWVVSVDSKEDFEAGRVHLAQVYIYGMRTSPAVVAEGHHVPFAVRKIRMQLKMHEESLEGLSGA